MSVKPLASVQTALRVLEIVGREQPIGVGAVAVACSISKSTAQRALVTLNEAGWIAPDSREHKRWVLTSKALTIGGHFTRVEARDVALPLLTKLRDETGETSLMSVLDGSDVVFVAIMEATAPLRVAATIGMSQSATRTASGAVLASLMTDSQLTSTFGTGAADSGFRGRLQQAREHGFAVNLGEDIPGFHSVAAPMRDTTGQPVAALVVTALGENLPEARAHKVGSFAVELLRGVVLPPR